MLYAVIIGPLNTTVFVCDRPDDNEWEVQEGVSLELTPFSVTVVVGSANSVSAPSPQQFNKSTYNFISWSDGGPPSHTITAPAVNTTYTATYRKR